MLSYAMLGRIADAEMMLARLREAGAHSTLSQLKKYLPHRRQEDIEFYLQASWIAGMPE